MHILSVAVFRLLWQKLSSREKPKIFCSLALYGKNVLTRGGMAKAPYPPPRESQLPEGSVCSAHLCFYAFLIFMQRLQNVSYGIVSKKGWMWRNCTHARSLGPPSFPELQQHRRNGSPLSALGQALQLQSQGPQGATRE